MYRFSRLGCIALLVIGLSSSHLDAQSTFAAVQGTVTDAVGAEIPNATVTITNTSTGIVTTSKTNGKGFYTFPQLQIGGPYTVDVDASGFKKFKSTGLMLNLNDNRSVDAKLDVGSTAETVEVEAAGGQVELQDTQLKNVISAVQIEQVPLFGRDASGLQKLQPGSVESSDRFGGYAANGSQSTSNAYILDGIDINDGPLQNSGFTANPDALAQEAIITSTINPEYARNSGAVINQTIKSGTNAFHGSAFEFYRDTFLNNGDYFSLPGQRPPFHQNLYGGTIGGPIFKNKLFFFLGYQGLRNRTGTTDTVPVLSAAERNGVFPDGTVISPKTFNPISVKLLNQFVPLPNTTSGGTPAYSFPTSDTSAQDQGIIRVDYHLSQKDSIFATSTFQSSPSSDTLSFGGGTLPGFGQNNAEHFKLFSADYTHTFSPNLLNELQATYYRFNYAAVEPQQIVQPSSYGFQINPQSSSSGLPLMTVQGFFNLGFSFEGPQPRKDTNLRATDAFTWVKGNHTLKFGASVEQFRVSNPYFGNNNGNFSFNNSATDPFLSVKTFLTGTPVNYTQGSGGFIDTIAFENYFYAQDSWKVSQDLVLNYGAAYDIETPNSNHQFDGLGISCFSISDATTNVFPGANAPPGLLYPGDPGCNNAGGATTKYDHVAPRFGFAYSPSGGPAFLGNSGAHSLSIRGGFGIYYNRDQQEGQLQNLSTPPFSLTANVQNPSFANPLGVGAGVANPFPFVAPAKGSTINWGNYAGLDINSFDRNYSVPYVYNFNLNVQKELPSNILVQVGYVGSLGHKLVIVYEGDPITSAGHAACVADINGCGAPDQISTHLNYPQYTAQPATVPGSGGVPYYLSVGTQATQGSSNYNSAQVSVTKIPTHGLSFSVAYTYSKALDNASGLESSGFNGRGYNQYPGYGSLNYGPSDYDARQRLAVSYVYQVPVFHGSNLFLREALSGWEIAGYTALQSGNPLNITETGVYLSKWCDQYSYYSCPDNPNTSSFSIKKSNPRNATNNYFDTTPFSSEAVGSFGNVPRGLVSGPGFNYTNLTIAKNFPLSSDGIRSLQLRLEAANAFNHANFDNPDANFGDINFGVVSAVKASADANGDPQGGRAIQLVGKFYF